MCTFALATVFGVYLVSVLVVRPEKCVMNCRDSACTSTEVTGE